MNINDTLNTHPNFTILAPGMCNAACQFCFWNHQDGKIKPDDQYFANLKRTLVNLPNKYRSISVSGGEPSLSPHLKRIVDIILNIRTMIRHYDRVVLTSNGAQLDVLQRACARGNGIDFLNISRHHYDDAENAAIFKANRLPVPTSAQLAAAIPRIDAPVTLNCVISNQTDRDFIFRYIQFARGIGAHSVSFRKEASDITPTPVEREFTALFGAGQSNDCPVCRGHTQNLNGMEVRWKGSYTEPSIQVNKTYEAVFHADGRVYADWGRKHPLSVPELTFIKPPTVPELAQAKRDVHRFFEEPAPFRSYGCGGGGCGSAGRGGSARAAGCGSAGCG